MATGANVANAGPVDHRCLERHLVRVKVTGATEHGEHTLLIYNQHQPSSDRRPFKPTQKMNCCWRSSIELLPRYATERAMLAVVLRAHVSLIDCTWSARTVVLIQGAYCDAYTVVLTAALRAHSF